MESNFKVEPEHQEFVDALASFVSERFGAEISNFEAYI